MIKTMFNQSCKKFIKLLFLPFFILSLDSCTKESEEPPVPVDDTQALVIDVTKPESSGINIVSLDYDGTLTVESTEENAPKVGDVLYSGRSEISPYGFILHVTDVVRKGEAKISTRSLDDLKKYIFIIKTTAGAVNEIVKNLSIAYHVDLKNIDIDEITDSEGRTLDVDEMNEREWKVPLKDLKLGNVSLSPEIIFRPKDMILYLDVKDGEFQKFGADLNLEMETLVSR